MLLLPILLSLLRTRIPKLLDHPALLAHTIYQAVVFDDAVRAGDFDLSKTSIYDGVEGVEWEGLTGVLLREEGWFERWLAGEKRCERNVGYPAGCVSLMSPSCRWSAARVDLLVRSLDD
jgi:hypothetical protein